MRIVHKCLFCAKNCTDFVNNSGTYVECILSHMESTSTEDPKSLQRQKFLCKRTHVLFLLGTGSLVRNGLVLSYLGQNALSGMALAQSLVGQAALFIKHSVKDISSAAPANANTLWQS